MGMGSHGDQLDIAALACRAIVERMDDGVIVLDATMRILDVNPSAEDMLGRPGAQMMGQPAGETLSDWPLLLEMLGKADSRRVEVCSGHGARRRLLTVRVFSLNELEEQPGGSFIILRDVTNRQRIERDLERARDAAKAAGQDNSEFMSVASHEMRTPITCIKGFADLLTKGTAGPVNAFQADFLGTIRANADRLAGLVSNLSDIARIEAGRLRLERGSVALNEVVRDAAEAMQSQIDEKGQVLTVDVPVDLPGLDGDHDRLVQVVVNLLSNAHKFTPPGGRITVIADVVEDSDAGKEIRATVEDNGIGIAPDEQGRVFERFYRSEDRQASEAPGSGLGLTIAKSLIEMQGGRIWLESTYGGGTKVHLALPVIGGT
jgi:PAS domain S-box-containing protein